MREGAGAMLAVFLGVAGLAVATTLIAIKVGIGR